MNNIKFGYFSEAQAEQYNFYRVPKALFTEEYFKGLSCEAKILYGLMLDRIGLSIKNQWFDDQGRAYIIFTVADVKEILGCQSQKAVRLMKELDVSGGIGLIEKKRIGLGRPNIIYVKNFMVREDGGGHKTNAVPGGFSGNCASMSHSKDSADREEDVNESICSCLDACVSHPAKKAGTAVVEMDKTMETGGQIQSGKISIMEECPAADDVQDQEMDGNIEKDWWMGDAEIPEMAGLEEINARQNELDWWMLETHAADGAFDNQKSAMPECISKAGGIGVEYEKQEGMLLGTGYVENVDNVDKRQEESRAGSENQISVRRPASFMDEISGTAAEYGFGMENVEKEPVGWMTGSVSVPENGRIQGAGERSACREGNYVFKDKEVEDLWRSVFKEKPDIERCSGTEQLEDAVQEFPEMNFRCGEIRDSGFVQGKAAEFWNTECNDTNTSDTEYIRETESNENNNNNTDCCDINQSYQSYQSYQSGMSLQQGQEGWKQDRIEDGKMEIDAQETKSTKRHLPENRDNTVMEGRVDAYREIIRDNISYGCFQNRADMGDVDELVELMVDTMMAPDGSTIRVAGMDRPASMVKGRFMKLAYSHIEYVMDCLQKHTGKIWNIKAYLLTALYNSTLTISSYYRAEVNHDLYGGC